MQRRQCRILVVDDELAMREVLQARLEQWGFPVQVAANVESAQHLVRTFDPHVVISDLVLPDATGMSLLETLRGQDGQRTVLLITAYGTIDTAVRAIKAGATDFLTKPLDYVALRRLLQTAEERLANAGQGKTKAAASDLSKTSLPLEGGMIGASLPMQVMHEQLTAAAPSDAPVLIVGESGSGKELVARTLHLQSRRQRAAFVPVNAAAIPLELAEAELFGVERGAFTGATGARAGLFEQAHCGTLFLDEVTEMPLALQAKLLRILEDGTVRRLGSRVEMACDVRLVAATNRDPLRAVEEGRLRQDLLYRLDVLRVQVPSLRARKDDIPELVAHFLSRCAARYGSPAPSVSPEVLAQLYQHDWPGNVRELRNVVERLFVSVRGATVMPEHLQRSSSDAPPPTPPEPLGIVLPHGSTAAEAERIVIVETLRATGNNKAETARRLGLDVKTIRNKLRAFGLGGATE